MAGKSRPSVSAQQNLKSFFSVNITKSEEKRRKEATDLVSSILKEVISDVFVRAGIPQESDAPPPAMGISHSTLTPATYNSWKTKYPWIVASTEDETR